MTAEVQLAEARSLKEGALADIAVLDNEEEWSGDPAQFHSKGKNSVLKDKTLKGKAVHTVVGGRVKYRDGSLVD